jgi:hypothetical protein
MKRYLALILSLWVGVAQAQATLACQFREGNGFTWKNGQWQPQRFSPDKPFFLTIDPDKRLNPKSALLAFGEPLEMAERKKNDANWVSCFLPSAAANSSACSDFLGNSITVSLSSMEGAVSTIHGAAQKNNDKDDLVLKPFVCQKM